MDKMNVKPKVSLVVLWTGGSKLLPKVNCRHTVSDEPVNVVQPKSRRFPSGEQMELKGE